MSIKTIISDYLESGERPTLRIDAQSEVFIQSLINTLEKFGLRELSTVEIRPGADVGFPTETKELVLQVGNASQIRTTKGSGVIWEEDVEGWLSARDKLKSLLDSGRPGHHYFDCRHGSLQIEVSLNEWRPHSY